jgi:hypothetical protein
MAKGCSECICLGPECVDAPFTFPNVFEIFESVLAIAVPQGFLPFHLPESKSTKEVLRWIIRQYLWLS